MTEPADPPVTASAPEASEPRSGDSEQCEGDCGGAWCTASRPTPDPAQLPDDLRERAVVAGVEAFKRIGLIGGLAGAAAAAAEATWSEAVRRLDAAAASPREETGGGAALRARLDAVFDCLKNPLSRYHRDAPHLSRDEAIQRSVAALARAVLDAASAAGSPAAAQGAPSPVDGGAGEPYEDATSLAFHESERPPSPASGWSEEPQWDERPADQAPRVVAERARQIAKGYTPEHDDEHTLRDLAGYADFRLARLSDDDCAYPGDEQQALVEVRALLLALVEGAERRIDAAAAPAGGVDREALRAVVADAVRNTGWAPGPLDELSIVASIAAALAPLLAGGGGAGGRASRGAADAAGGGS